MKYELLPNAAKGVLVDRTPIMRDIRDTFRVSFLLPCEGSFIALFRGADGVEHRKTIKDGICKVPKELLTREQFVELIVLEIDGERILRSWSCESLKITSMYSFRQSQWQISGGMTEIDCFERLNDIERQYAETAEKLAQSGESLEAIKKSYEALCGIVEGIKAENRQIVTNYNVAIEVINDLQCRLNALEKHYDPTLIK